MRKAMLASFILPALWMAEAIGAGPPGHVRAVTDLTSYNVGAEVSVTIVPAAGATLPSIDFLANIRYSPA